MFQPKNINGHIGKRYHQDVRAHDNVDQDSVRMVEREADVSNNSMLLVTCVTCMHV